MCAAHDHVCSRSEPKQLSLASEMSVLGNALDFESLDFPSYIRSLSALEFVELEALQQELAGRVQHLRDNVSF